MALLPTNVVPTNSTDGRLGFFPAKGQDNDILAFRDRQINRWNVSRCRHLWRVGRDVHYTLGNQWIERDKSGAFPRGMGFAFSAMRSPIKGIDLPVNNKIGPAVEIEVASILKRQWVPTTVSSSKDPRVEAAAQVAKDVLLYRLREQNWPQVRYDNTWNFVVMGTGILNRCWDESYVEVDPIGAPTAMFCSDCGKGVYSKEIPESAYEMIPEKFRGALKAPPPDPARAKMSEEMGIGENPFALGLEMCPSCGGSFREGRPDDNFEGDDLFGRSLNIDAPKGKLLLEADTPFEWYPENGGFQVNPYTMRRYGRRKVRSLDWVDEHYPGAIENFKIEPVSPQEIMMEHPQLSEWALMNTYSGVYDTGVYDHHVLVDELAEMPTLRHSHGRYVACIGDHLLRDDDLLKEGQIGNTSKKVYVPRLWCSPSRFRPRPGEIYGNGLPTSQISRQNRYNAILFQLAYTRDTLGSPTILAPDGMQLTGPEYIKGQGSRVMFYTVDPTAPGPPQVIQGTLFPDGSYKELDQLEKDMKEDVGPQEVEYGMAPRNVTTTSGLQLLGENAERRRNPREVEYFTSIENAWSHLLQAEWAFRSERSMYAIEGEDNTWAQKQYDQLTICGQTKIKIEKEAYTDSNIYQKEAAREAQVDGLIDISSPVARRRQLKLRGLPEDVNEDSNLQVDQATRYFIDFIDEQIIPVIDETADNMEIHKQVIGAKFKSDEGKDLERAVGWHDLIRVFGDWQMQLTVMEQQADAALQIYKDPDDVQGNAEIFAKLTLQFQKEEEQFEQLIAQGEKIIAKGGQPQQPPAPPMKPPPPIFPPPLIQDRIIGIWIKKLGPKWVDKQVPFREKKVSIRKFLEFRAVYEGYRLLAMRTAGAPPAPGSGATMLPGDPGTVGNVGTAGTAGGEPPTPQVNSMPEGGRVTGGV